MELIQVNTTFDNKDEAEKVAEILLEQKLVACVQILGPATSKYWWEGKIDKATEYVCFVKTTKELFEEVKSVIQANHSYELPEIIALPIADGEAEYLEWFKGNIK